MWTLDLYASIEWNTRKLLGHLKKLSNFPNDAFKSVEFFISKDLLKYTKRMNLDIFFTFINWQARPRKYQKDITESYGNVEEKLLF